MAGKISAAATNCEFREGAESPRRFRVRVEIFFMLRITALRDRCSAAGETDGPATPVATGFRPARELPLFWANCCSYETAWEGHKDYS
jgi:hypothetical protein